MFKFNLQTILDVRKTLEDQSLNDFAQKQKELQRENDQLQLIQQQKRSLINDLRNVQGKTVNVSEIKLNMEFLKECSKKESGQKEHVSEAERMLKIKKEALLEAIQKRKSMEILKAKQYDLHQFNLNLIERTAIDEMALVRHNRKKDK
jgi:flagellar export protein FliJ